MCAIKELTQILLPSRYEKFLFIAGILIGIVLGITFGYYLGSVI